MKWDKQYHVTGAIWRMLQRGCIDKAKAIDLMHTRAKLSKYLAKATVEVWLTHSSMRYRT